LIRAIAWLNLVEQRRTTMATAATTAAATDRAAGRGYFWAGIALAVLALGGSWVQLSLRQLFVPWYMPALTTIGALLMLLALARRPTVTRTIGLVLLTALAGLEWFFLVSLARLPEYAGPARAGSPVPAFQTTLAGGRTFTHQDLQDGKATVMTFFRGRW
jgi:hypothetical protein